MGETGAGGEKSTDVLLEILTGGNRKLLAQTVRDLARTLEESTLANRKTIAQFWRSIVASDGYDHYAAAFVVLMALISPTMHNFVIYLQQNGDADRVACFKRFVEIESTIFFTGCTRDYEQVTHIEPTGAPGERVPVYSCMQVFVLLMITTYASNWDPSGHRYYHQRQLHYEQQIRRA